RKRRGKSPSEAARFSELSSATGHEISVRRGFIGKLIRFCREMQITHDFIDNRVELAQVEFPFQASLRKHQRYVVELVSKKDIGIIVAPPGAEIGRASCRGRVQSSASGVSGRAQRAVE